MVSFLASPIIFSIPANPYHQHSPFIARMARNIRIVSDIIIGVFSSPWNRALKSPISLFPGPISTMIGEAWRDMRLDPSRMNAKDDEIRMFRV